MFHQTVNGVRGTNQANQSLL